MGRIHNVEMDEVAQQRDDGSRDIAKGAAISPSEPAASRQDPHDADMPARFSEVVLPHLDAAYNLARFLTRDTEAAEDIVQDAFLRAYRWFDGYRGGDPRSWILKITRNCFLTWNKAKRPEETRPLEDGATNDFTNGEDHIEALWEPDHNTPEMALVRREEIETVRSLIEALPEPFREALVLRELEDLSYREIAEITAAPVGTVMSRLARARQMFGEAWQRLAEKQKG